MTNLILESRSVVQDREDKRHIVHLQQRGSYVGLHVEHKRGGDEPLLWIPDVVLGAVNADRNGNQDYILKFRDRDRVLVEENTPSSK